MSFYSSTTIEDFVKHSEEIIKKAHKKELESVEPTLDKRWEIINTVKDFIINKKRKLYGGLGLNKLIQMKNMKDAFYDDEDVDKWDIDFYSPDPINDAMEIANLLHKKKFKLIRAAEAQHEETYTVYVEGIKCADASYVPRNVYNKIPFNDVKGLIIAGPHFMMIDYFRVLTDPLTSYFRLEKTFQRLLLMTKYYPLPKVKDTNVAIVSPDKELDIAFRTVNDFLKNKETIVTVGMYAYNHLIKECKTDRVKYSDVNYYEVVSTFYKKDVKDLIFALYDKFPMAKSKITYKEFYPFFQYFGFRTQIYYDETLICVVYHHNMRCTPYNKVLGHYFTKKSFEEEKKDKINIGSFSMIVLYNLINVMMARTNNDDITKDLYYKLLSNMIDMQEYNMTKNNKTIFDDGLFKEFVVDCIGSTISLKMAHQQKYEKRKKAGHMISWNYNPEIAKDKDVNTFFFKNSSGNIINNQKNMKIDLTAVFSEYSELDDSSDLVEIKGEDVGEENKKKI